MNAKYPMLKNNSSNTLLHAHKTCRNPAELARLALSESKVIRGLLIPFIVLFCGREFLLHIINKVEVILRLLMFFELHVHHLLMLLDIDA